MNRITVLLAIGISLFVAKVTFGDTNTQSQLVFENIIGNLATSNPTIGGILTNVVVEGGFSASLQKPLSPHGSLSEAYPLIKVSKGAVVETLMFVHSNGVQTQGTPDEIGFGLNTYKRTTPRPLNLAIGTVAPVAHHGVFVNVTVSTSRAVHGRFDLADTFWQAGGFVTF